MNVKQFAKSKGNKSIKPKLNKTQPIQPKKVKPKEVPMKQENKTFELKKYTKIPKFHLFHSSVYPFLSTNNIIKNETRNDNNNNNNNECKSFNNDKEILSLIRECHDLRKQIISL